MVGCGVTIYPIHTNDNNNGSDVVDNVHHWGVIGTYGVGRNFQGFKITPAGVNYYNALISEYGGLPQDTTGTGLMIGFIPALKANEGCTLQPDGNYCMTEQAHLHYMTMIRWSSHSIKPQSWIKSVL